MQANLRNLNKLLVCTWPTKGGNVTGKCFKSTKKCNSVSNETYATRRWNSLKESFLAKGFLRSNNPYYPPENVKDEIVKICQALQIPKDKNYQLNKPEEKFKLLEACNKHFNYSVPNSQVHELKTMDDAVKFYSRPIDTTVPYDALREADLPENLHIEFHYLRFGAQNNVNNSCDKTAFPKSSTLVTGLKYRGKYPGYEAKRHWP